LDTEYATFEKIQLLLHKHRNSKLMKWFPEANIKNLFDEVFKMEG